MIFASLDGVLLAAAPPAAIRVDFDSTFLVQVVLFVAPDAHPQAAPLRPDAQALRGARAADRRRQARRRGKIDEKSASALTKYEAEMAKARAAGDAEREKIRAEAVKREQEILGDRPRVDRQDLEDGKRAARRPRPSASAHGAQGRSRRPWRATWRPRPRARGAVVKAARSGEPPRRLRRDGARHGVVGLGAWVARRSPPPANADARPRREASTPPRPKARGAEDEEERAASRINFGPSSASETPPFLAMLINFGILAGGYYLLGQEADRRGAADPPRHDRQGDRRGAAR